MTNEIFVALFLFVVLLIALPKSRTANGKGLRFFRTFFPSWRFFEEVAELPYLEYRLSTDGENFSAWHPGLVRPTRRWHSLLFNPQGNLYLATESLLQQLATEIGDLTPDTEAEFHRSTTFELVLNLVRGQIRAIHGVDPQTRFQLQVLRVRQGERPSSGELMLRSSVIPLHA